MVAELASFSETSRQRALERFELLRVDRGEVVAAINPNRRSPSYRTRHCAESEGTVPRYVLGIAFRR